MHDSTRKTAAPEMPDALRSDVRLLGELLGTVLVEAGGQQLFDDVEDLRAATIEAYEGNESSLEYAQALVESFSVKRASEVARAFTCYFHLVNTAEEYHRVRSLRKRDHSVSSDVQAGPKTVAEAVVQLNREVGIAEAQRRLAELEFRPVFTAHPTEARRRAVSSAIRRISDLLGQLDDPRGGEIEKDDLKAQLLSQINVLWRTAPIRSKDPSPLDEVRTIMGIFDSTLFEQLPKTYRAIDMALQPGQSGVAKPMTPAFVKFGSWIGGDRDGNPNVTSRITRDAALIAAEHILLGLEKHTRRLGRELTIEAALTPPSELLVAMLMRQRDLDVDRMESIENRSPNEPHRQALLFMAERLKATRLRDADLAYGDVSDFLDDLSTIQQSLDQAGDARNAYGELQHLVWQAESFGFHLAELEVRQHSQVHRETLEEIDRVGDGPELSERSREVLDTMRAISAIQLRFGERAASRYIVSFTQSAKDLESVYRLAQIATNGNPPDLQVIPLFETFDDLQNSVAVLEQMLTISEVQDLLEKRGRRLEVMLGYSDSSKDVGPVSATLALYDAQKRISQWARDQDIALTLFHGRGGALGRGGGPAHRAILSQPPLSVNDRFKVTEQGEVIFARYGDPTIAARHINQVAAATLMAGAPSIEKRNDEAAQKFAPMAQMLDSVSRQRFLELVQARGFPQWFAHITPLEEIGMLSLGSRPAKRGLSVDSLEDLRAIPWVFAWTQARINLTGWFGLGSALAAIGDIAWLQEAYRDWPLFTTMIDNVEMSLAKTDEHIARRYLALGDRKDLAQSVIEEMRLTREWVLKVTGHSRPLESTYVLGRAVQLRSPYVDALSLIQLRALEGLRTGQNTPELKDLLLLTVSGVAAGLQNTG